MREASRSADVIVAKLAERIARIHDLAEGCSVVLDHIVTEGDFDHAVLLLSTDFEEVVSVCRRTLVFVRGTVTAELSGPTLTVAGLTRAASAMPPSTAGHP